VEIICFGDTADALHQYLDRYDYSSYETYYGWEWENVPPSFLLSPSQTSKYPPLCLYDGSTVCGNVVSLTGKSSGEIYLSPVGIAGLTPRSFGPLATPVKEGEKSASWSQQIPLCVLSLITRSETVGVMEIGSKPVGECISSSYLISIGTKSNLSRGDYVSNRQYLRAALAASFPSHH
jgi:hypothetical protein